MEANPIYVTTRIVKTINLMKNQMMMMMIIQFFMIYVPSQQVHGQLQTRNSADTGNHIQDKHSIKTRDKLQTNSGGRNTLIQKN
jgi:hypothetical protein